MAPPTLPFETLTNVFQALDIYEVIEDHVTHSDIFNCSLVSHNWRVAALPLLWENILFLFGDAVEYANRKFDFKISDWERLASSLKLEHDDALQNHFDRVSYIRNVQLCAIHRDRGPMLDNATASVYCIAKLFRPSQLWCIDISLTNCYPQEPYIDILRSIFPELSQNVKHLNFADNGCKLRNIVKSNNGAFPFIEDDIILKNLPKSLETLTLIGEYLDTDQTPAEANYDDIFTLPKLRKLGLRHLYIGAEQLEQGLQTWHPDFAWLEVNHSADLCRSSVVWGLANYCHNLRKLILRYWKYAGATHPPPDISEDSLCHLIDSCQHLNTLKLVQVTNVTNRFLAHCAAYACNLSHFEIKQPGIHLTGEGIVDMSGWKQSMRIICIQRYGNMEEPTEMNQAFVENVREQCKHLRFTCIGKFYSFGKRP
ncbi:hypothetical protein BC938DRAFT_481481 [Jimgerdemannia flammicorona]|uniref:F-box domain-containing protein n=1 Tax=Jimgerdemannia flammicorona TaxID=994334 RepID=A0A433QG35_9FUNG|nr:hypothetical protein BC938DRAFT_481481 [Jimgerdemannia flammicorona]